MAKSYIFFLLFFLPKAHEGKELLVLACNIRHFVQDQENNIRESAIDFCVKTCGLAFATIISKKPCTDVQETHRANDERGG